MEILAVAGVHGRTLNLKKVLKLSSWDALLIAGDVAPYWRPGAARDILIDIVREFGNPVVVVAGNMDSLEAVLSTSAIENIFPLHGDVYRLGELEIVGIGGSPPTPFGTPTELGEKEIESLLLKAFSKLSRDSEVLVLSHAPPYGTAVDMARGRIHVGSRALRRVLENSGARVRLCMCGHVHEARGRDTVGGVTVVNVGPLMLGYYAVVRIGRELEVELRSI